MTLALPADWLARLQAQADRPPRRPRLPLWWGPATIGSVEPGLLEKICLQRSPHMRELLQKTEQKSTIGWQAMDDDLTAGLAQIAVSLRDAGLAGAWRDEQLAVTGIDTDNNTDAEADGTGRVLGTVERAVVRPLGIPTRAVHLAGQSTDGRHWVQQRSLTKPNDPGLWDTLVGGMVPAADTLEEALARETWEEAGLLPTQLERLVRGGRIDHRGPTGDAHGAGYLVETIDWYRCVLPDGVLPVNQDGEVAQFRLMAPDEVRSRLLAGNFTLEAALILSAASA